jgi:hypothetical protein
MAVGAKEIALEDFVGEGIEALTFADKIGDVAPFRSSNVVEVHHVVGKALMTVSTRIVRFEQLNECSVTKHPLS